LREKFDEAHKDEFHKPRQAFFQKKTKPAPNTQKMAHPLPLRSAPTIIYLMYPLQAAGFSVTPNSLAGEILIFQFKVKNLAEFKLNLKICKYFIHEG
jgi:hypothetical protein